VLQLAGSAYGQNSIRDLMRMSSGVRWSEDYATSGDSDIVLMGRAMRSGQPGAVMELMRTRPRAAAPGSLFNYSTGDSYVLGAVLAAATGKRMADYLSQKVWTPLGMEADGYWLLDAPDRLEMGGNNISATLRDHGRFGLFFLRQGVVNGSRVLPDGWREQAGQPGAAVTAHGQFYRVTRWAIAISGGRFPPVRTRSRSTTAPSPPWASSASSSTSTRRRTWSRWSGAPGVPAGSTRPSSRPTPCSAPR
jgi:CubicO group peptidase (beta-lactamase class C family)